MNIPIHNIAGFYCEPSELADNARVESQLKLTFGVIAVAYIMICATILYAADFNPDQKVIAKILMVIGAVLIVVGCVIVSFSMLPHWCGN